MDIIETKKLVKNYESGEVVTKVLHGINLKVAKGEWLAVMGPSGSGKSTLLYQMGLIDYPTAGRVVIEGNDVTDLDHSEKQKIRLFELGFVFQDYALIPELSAVENVMVPLIMMGFSRPDAYKRGKKYLSRMGLSERLDNLPSQLSGGEQQRVSVARAVAHEPKILFADEPTASLDSVMSLQVIEVLEDLHQAGQTIVMVTHEDVYGAYAQRIVYLKDGIIQREKKARRQSNKQSRKKSKKKSTSP